MKILLFLVPILLIVLISGCVNNQQEETTTSTMPTTTLPTTIISEGFCGSSTFIDCNEDSDCKAGGCSGQVCSGVGEDIITTCEWVDCYNAERYGLRCGCIDNKCQWG